MLFRGDELVVEVHFKELSALENSHGHAEPYRQTVQSLVGVECVCLAAWGNVDDVVRGKLLDAADTKGIIEDIAQ